MFFVRLAVGLAACLLLGVTFLRAQTLVTGRAVDAEGGPLEGVVLTTTAERVVTGRDGSFLLSDPGGIHDLTAEGYEITRSHVDGAAGIVLVLSRRPARLQEHVVVTAHRRETDALVLPGSVSVVTRRQLEMRLPRTTPEALMETAGVLVQKTNHGGGSPYLRGLVGNQVLVLVDGVRLNNATYRLGPNQYLATIDPATIERIEVLRGPGAVLHGTDALGGVVQIVTRTPTPRGGGWFLDARSTVKGATGTPERSARVDLEGGRGRMAWLGGVSVRSFGDLRAGGELGVRAPSAYDEVGADVKGRWEPAANRSLTLTAQHVRQDNVGRFDQVAQRGFQTWAFDPQQRWLAAATYAHDVKTRGVERVAATVSLQRTREDRRYRRRGADLEVVERDAVRAFGANLDVTWRPFAGWRVGSGVDITHDDVRSGRTDADVRTGAVTHRRGLYADGATATSAALFTHAQREFGRVHVEGGIRHATYAVDTSAPTFGNFSVRSSALVAQGGVSVEAASAVHPYASVWQGFRAPNIDDLSTLGSFDFGVEVPTTTLQPESSLGGEVGVKWRRSRWSGSAAVYRLDLRDLIERTRGTWLGDATYDGQAVYVRANVGTAYVRGVEVDSAVRLSDALSLDGSVTQTHGQQVSRNEPMRRIPPVHGALRVTWQPGGGRHWMEVGWRGASRQDRLASGDRDDHRIDPTGTAAWHTLFVRGGWRLHDGLELVGGIDNSLDQPYRIHGSGIDGAGRTVWLGAHVRPF